MSCFNVLMFSDLIFCFVAVSLWLPERFSHHWEWHLLNLLIQENLWQWVNNCRISMVLSSIVATLLLTLSIGFFSMSSICFCGTVVMKVLWSNWMLLAGWLINVFFCFEGYSNLASWSCSCRTCIINSASYQNIPSR